MRNTNKSTKRAFTLIELLIVIAIIGILFVVLVSKVDFATDKAKASGVQTDFRSFQVAFETVSKENAGFASLGWDTGDENGDRIRNSYDEGDDDEDGIMDPGETWTGHKVYGEDWTGTYTLINPDDNTDKSAFKLLEDKVNANLDPKLHITITPEENAGVLTGNAKVTMANGAKDPWKNEYHGVYITNVLNDKGDRGAFIIYSNGANGQWGSEHRIANGNVSIIVPGNNVRGKDDYSMSVFYSYANGYGEVAVVTTGFSNNQTFLDGAPTGELDVVLPEIPNDDTDEEKENIDNINTTFAPGLYETGALELYRQGNVDEAKSMLISSWDELLAEEIVCMSKGFDIPEGYYLNEYGFYYGLPYKLIIQGETLFSLTLYEDGSVLLVDSDTTLLPSGSVSYSFMSVDMTALDLPVLKVTNNGQALNWEEAGYDFLLGGQGVAGTVSATPDKQIVGDLVLPNNTTGLNVVAFVYQQSMTDIYLPEGIETIPMGAFNNCQSLKNLILPNSLKSISNETFCNCDSLLSVVIPNSVVFIGEYAFEGCDALETVVIGDGVIFIDEDAFAECDNLKTVSLGTSLQTIESYTFYRCPTLEAITIPNSVSVIYSNAFYCTSLKSVVIGKGVTLIKTRAFYFCGISSITFMGTVEEWNAIEKGDDWLYVSGSVQYVQCSDGEVSIK